jgi:ABC-type polysaccharide/polyol phosphate export permease
MTIFNRKYLNLLREIAITQFKLKDQSTFFGFFWGFLNPVVMLIILFILFSTRLGKGIDHYPIYLLIGIIQYTHFSNCTSRSLTVLHSMQKLTSDTIFPKEVLVIGSVMSNTIEFILSMVACLLIAAFSGINLSWAVVMLPLVVVLQLILATWVSLILSCLYVFVRDVNHIYQVFLRLLIFITPIFYDISFLGQEASKYIILLNPLAHLINFSRTIIIDGKMFSIELSMVILLLNATFLYFSLKIFKRYEPIFAENL